MKNIKNTTKYSIVLSLGILVILALIISVLPAKANASYNYTYNIPGGPGIYNPDTGPSYNQQSYYPYNYNYYTPAPTQVVYVAPEPVYVPATPIVYSNTANQNSTVTSKTVVAKAKPKTTTTVAKVTTTDKSNLAANAILGSSIFMPSSLIQWIFFAILVLLIVILVRRIYGGSEKYNAIPMKHS